MDVEKYKSSIVSAKTIAATTTTAITDTSPQKQRMAQNFLLMWMDASIDESNRDCQNTLTELRGVANNIDIFKSADQCVDFLSEVENESAFLIIAGTIGKQIIPLIHDIPQLDAIYIFCGNKSRHEQWTEKWVKVQGVHTDIKPICEALQVVAKQCHQDAIAVSFVTMGQGGSNQNLDQLEPSFMYTQIFKEILLEMNHDDKSIQDLVLYCREQFASNMKELNIIDEFGHEYQSKLSIWWYTRECFTYQMLNRALRTLEADTIITMGFFIRDLHIQIEQLHQEQVSGYRGESFIVYRGQGLLETDFEKLSKTKGGLISFNNFLSTSKKREVSIGFAKRALMKTDMVGILFQMAIDPSISSILFAAIDEVSYFKTEEEILFSMHTVFRIEEIKKLEKTNRLYQVELTLTSEDDQQLRQLTDRIRQEVKGSGWHRLGDLLITMGQFNKAEELYTVLLDQTSDEGARAIYYSQLGLAIDNQGNYKKAIWYYKKTLEIQETILRPNDLLLATSYNNIGSVYKNMEEYSNALLFLEKGVRIREKNLSPDDPSLATSYNNIGSVYNSMGEYSKALLFYEKNLEILEKTLPSNHPHVASSYNNIGAVYDNMGEYAKALSFYEKDLEICQKALPPNHPSLAISYNNIGGVYRNMGNNSKALSFYVRSMDILRRSLPPDHPHIQDVRESIKIINKKL